MMTKIASRESCKRTFELAVGGEGKVWLDISIINVDRETTQNIVKVVEHANEEIQKILAGDSGKDNKQTLRYKNGRAYLSKT